jgi:hypothetical protein
MTSDEPPDGEENPGEETSPIPGFRLPQAEDVERREANLFVPDNMTPGEALNIRVWRIDATTMEWQTRRRC